MISYVEYSDFSFPPDEAPLKFQQTPQGQPPQQEHLLPPLCLIFAFPFPLIPVSSLPDMQYRTLVTEENYRPTLFGRSTSSCTSEATEVEYSAQPQP
jgi:hypothetical protein